MKAARIFVDLKKDSESQLAYGECDYEFGDKFLHVTEGNVLHMIRI